MLETIPVPTGTRDVLPEEMAELRAISTQVGAVFAAAGYGEVATPALEFEDTVRIGAPEVGTVYRVPDADGQVLVLRFDSTIPIARLAATRYHDAEPPLRFCYLQHVYRPVQPKRAQSREFLQIGMELMGLPAPAGDAEAITLLVKVLEAAGLNDFRIAVGDVSFFTGKLDAAGARGEHGPGSRETILNELSTRDMVGLERQLRASDSISDADRERLVEIAAARGGRELIEREGADRLVALDDLLRSEGIADKVIYDLGLIRSLSYYTGTVLEIYAPSSGFPIGGGGRYDDLVARFGRDLAAFGFAINMERLHLAVLAEQETSS
jgi:ATP phosphoribosyltransferase regulatory subunit